MNMLDYALAMFDGTLPPCFRIPWDTPRKTAVMNAKVPAHRRPPFARKSRKRGDVDSKAPEDTAAIARKEQRKSRMVKIAEKKRATSPKQS